MSTAVIVRSLVDETYREVEPMLNSIVWMHIKKYGGDFDEVKSNLNFHFIGAVRTYQLDKGKFETWCRHRIPLCLLEDLRSFLKKRKRHTQVAYNLEEHPETNPLQFDIDDFASSLSGDACEVIKLILNPPFDIQLNKNTRKNMKAALVEFLKDIGWGLNRITETFVEIKEALL